MTKIKQTAERALTIAGFDPSGGAGILADVRTFAAFGFQAVAAVTSITFQNKARVFGAMHQTANTVRAQVLPLLADFSIVCSKVGMLPTREVVLEVARLFQDSELPRAVVDPVMVSSSGHRLMEEEALDTVIKHLLPLARLVTPNIPEAEALTGMTINSEREMRQAATNIRELGAAAVLIKGGHLKATDEAIDVLDNEGEVTVFRETRVIGAALHGSGCIMSSAIAAGLAKGLTMEDSVGAAKSFVIEAIRNSAQRS